MAASQETLDKAFDAIVAAALAGERAPQTDDFYDICGYSGAAVVRPLVNAGRIRSEVYALNYRVFQILTGPHAGERTKEPPTAAPPYYKISDPRVRKRLFELTKGVAGVIETEPGPMPKRKVLRFPDW